MSSAGSRAPLSAAENDRLSAVHKGRLGLEIVSVYLRVRWLLRRAQLPGMLETLRACLRGTPGRPLAFDMGSDGEQLARAVVRTLAPLPHGSGCLTQSLVLLGLLARRGVSADLVIAVQPGVTPGLDAHAWVECDGRPLLAPAPTYGRLVTL